MMRHEQFGRTPGLLERLEERKSELSRYMSSMGSASSSRATSRATSRANSRANSRAATPAASREPSLGEGAVELARVERAARDFATQLVGLLFCTLAAVVAADLVTARLGRRP